MGKVLIIDVAKCNGCYNCQIVCKDEHVGNDWTPIAKPQPDTGQFWTHVEEITRGSVPKVKMAYMHSICQQCDDAPCLKACGAKAIYKRADGIVIIDPTKCQGHRNCIDACPYQGVIYFNWDLNIAQKCTMCAHLLDRGWKDTRCSEACPTGAYTFGEEEDLKDLIGKAEVLHPEYKTKPRVYYLNIPKRFIAGAVYDPEADECLEGVTVGITNTKSGKKQSLKTDNYGDFWFEKLEVGVYDLTIKKTGYLSQEMKAVSTEKDINVGDIKLYKKV
jgi:tetrathionate reductase subunit B